MTRKIQSVGDKFGDATILEFLRYYTEPSGKKRKLWLCECSCGNTYKAKAKSLNSNSACPSCTKERKLSFWKSRPMKLETKHRARYSHMIARCYDKNEIGYENYGARGISVCDRWLGEDGLSNFCIDMGECPVGFTLDRINVNGNYSPENCRWASKQTQGFNTRKHKTNTSGRTGVYWFSRVNKWIAAIVFNGVQKHLGYFQKFEDAVKAREDAEIFYFGELRPEGKDSYYE